MAITAQEVKTIRSLSRKKNRLENRQFIVEGQKIVKEVVQSSFKVDKLLCTAEANSSLSHANFEVISQKQMAQLSSLREPAGILAVVDFPPTAKCDYGLDFVLVLDGIRDPGNLGTLIRIADWFGIKQIWCSEDCVEWTNSKVIQATMGSFLRTEIIYSSLNSTLAQASENEIEVCGLVLGGDSLNEFKKSTKIALVIGSESHGISAGIQGMLDRSLAIEGRGGAESLNASIAAAIAAYQIILRS